MAKLTIRADGKVGSLSLRALKADVARDLLQEYVPLKEAARTLGVRSAYLRRWCEAHDVRCIQHDRQWWVHRRQLIDARLG